MPDLTTTYMGLTLRTPLVVSSCPLCESVENIRRMEEAGAGAVVLHSLFEEQINIESELLDRYLSHGADCYAEALSYFPDLATYKLGPEEYLEHIRRAKSAVSIPIIGSLNGVTPSGWIRYAKAIQQAGADALELNIYYIPTDPNLTGADVERRYVELVRAVKESVTIPVAVKLGHSFTAFANVAKQLEEAGADALVLFNRFYQPDFDVERLEIVPTLTLSRSYELLLRLHWVALLYGRIRADLAVTGGVHTVYDVVKAIMAGAQVAMMASALLTYGIGYMRTVLADLARWMDEHEYESLHQMRGSLSQHRVAEPAAFERANYLRVLSSFAWRSPDEPV
jgi:dihydroorotate dehydrogenase (fumarate)